MWHQSDPNKNHNCLLKNTLGSGQSCFNLNADPHTGCLRPMGIFSPFKDLEPSVTSQAWSVKVHAGIFHQSSLSTVQVLQKRACGCASTGSVSLHNMGHSPAVLEVSGRQVYFSWVFVLTRYSLWCLAWSVHFCSTDRSRKDKSMTTQDLT